MAPGLGDAELACDGVMPVWVAEARGIPLNRGYQRTLSLAPTAHSRLTYRVPLVGWSQPDVEPRMKKPGKGQPGPLPEDRERYIRRMLRHGAITAVVRWYMQIGPGVWDSLAVRSSRRLIRGRMWAKEHFEQVRGVARPDAEWWYRDNRFASPFAIEIDTSSQVVELMGERIQKWVRLYAGVRWVVLSDARAKSIYELGLGPKVEVYVLSRWWEPGGSLELWTANT